MLELPTIKVSLRKVTDWFRSLEQQEDPFEHPVPMHRQRWIQDQAEIIAPYAFREDPYGSFAVYAGNEPRFLRVNSSDEGSGFWLATAPCVVAVAYHDMNDKLVIEVVAIATRRQVLRAKRRLRQPNADLMKAVTKLPNTGKRYRRSTLAPRSEPMEPNGGGQPC